LLIGIVAALQVAISLLLIFLILLHAGRGGGVSDMFGGGGGFSGSSAITGSSVVERNLDRLTVTAAILFGVTTVSLTMMTN
jgi:preprotein translocase subunit SecG